MSTVIRSLSDAKNTKRSVHISDLICPQHPNGFSIPVGSTVVLEEYGFNQDDIDRSFFLRKAEQHGFIKIFCGREAEDIRIHLGMAFGKASDNRAGMKQILISRGHAMGDILMTLPAISAIKEQNPTLEIDYCTEPAFVDLLKGHPHIRNVYPIGGVSAKNYDQYINLDGGYERQHDWVRRHAIDLFADACGILPRERNIYYPIPVDVKSKVAGDLSRSGVKVGEHYVIGLHARKWDFSNSRNLSVNQYKQITTKLLALDKNVRILVFGNDVKDLGLPKNSRIVYLMRKTTHKELAAYIGYCDLLVGPDSGLIHIAGSQKVPFIGLFGPVEPSARVPHGGDYDTLTNAVECQPCGEMNCKHPEGNICITKVSVQDIVDLCARRMKMGSKKVSIVLLVYNQIDYLKKCVQCVHENTNDVDCEFIIVNNGSPIKGAKAYLDGLVRDGIVDKVIHLPENLGISGGWNTGIRAAVGEYICILNDDTEPEQRWLSSLVEAIESTPNAGVVGSKLLNPDRTIQHAGMDINGDGTNYDHIYWGVPEDDPRVNIFKQYPCVTGACIIFTREDWAKIHGFEDRYFAYKEDSDFCMKMKYYLGKDIYYQPKSVMVHHTAVTTNTIKKIVDVQAFRDRVFNLKWAHKLRLEAKNRATAKV